MSIIERHAQAASDVLFDIMNDAQRNTRDRVEAARILLDLYKSVRPETLEPFTWWDAPTPEEKQP